LDLVSFTEMTVAMQAMHGGFGNKKAPQKLRTNFVKVMSDLTNIDTFTLARVVGRIMNKGSYMGLTS
jgi:hypothetical protein